MQQNPLSNNHIVLNGMHHPLRPSPLSQNQRVTVSLPISLIERLRNAVYWTEDLPLAGLMAKALEDIVTQMEEANGGTFPQRVSPLKRGRRQRKYSPILSTPRGKGREVLSSESTASPSSGSELEANREGCDGRDPKVWDRSSEHFSLQTVPPVSPFPPLAPV